MTNYEYIQTCSEKEVIDFLCRGIGQDCHHCIAQEYCGKGHNGFIDWLKMSRRVHISYSVRENGGSFVVSEETGLIQNLDYLQSCSMEELAHTLCREMKQPCGMRITRNHCTKDDGFSHLLGQDKG